MILTIPQKMSGTGSIYDFASQDYDIEINFQTQYKYAVIAPDYYKLTPTRHHDIPSAMRAAKKLKYNGYHSVAIVDCAGNLYDFIHDELFQTGITL